MGPAIQHLMEAVVQIVSWGKNGAGTFNRAEYDYFAVWTFPNAETATQFEQMVDGAGWYNYFEQVNAMGPISTPQDVTGDMISS